MGLNSQFISIDPELRDAIEIESIKWLIDPASAPQDLIEKDMRDLSDHDLLLML